MQFFWPMLTAATEALILLLFVAGGTSPWSYPTATETAFMALSSVFYVMVPQSCSVGSGLYQKNGMTWILFQVSLALWRKGYTCGRCCAAFDQRQGFSSWKHFWRFQRDQTRDKESNWQTKEDVNDRNTIFVFNLSFSKINHKHMGIRQINTII